MAHCMGTVAQYSETARQPTKFGVGWAGVSQIDWTKLDVAALSARAVNKCVTSNNPRAVEPGRYTTILEPQAAGQFMAFAVDAMDRDTADRQGPYHDRTTKTKIGQRIFDERITIRSDPADPDCPYIPFTGRGEPYTPVTWVENGVLQNLAYGKKYAMRNLQSTKSLPNPLAFRMSGGETSLDEMIATTERGLLVTRFHDVDGVGDDSLLLSTVTGDGLRSPW